MKRILIHIGYGKTASTLFQKHLFSKHNEINYLGGVRFESYNSNKPILKNSYILFRAILTKDSTQFDTEYWRNYYKENLYNFLSNEKLNIFSEEWLTYTPVAMVNGDRGLVAQRIHDIFGQDVKILMVIRNQLDVLNSIYHKHLDTIIPLYSRDYSWGFRKNINRKSFYDLLIQTEDYGILSKYKYYALVKKYITLFNENLILKLYEDFNYDSESFLKNLAIDLGVSFAPFIKSYPLEKIKKSKPKQKTLISSLKKGISNMKHDYYESRDVFSGNFIGTQKVSALDTEEYINTYYREDNYKLGKLISRKLKKYGYPSK